MTLSLVVAVSKNGVIGRGGGLPWRLPSDLKQFKAVTMGKPVIMGRKTWDGLPRRPLPGRTNIVISRDPVFLAEGAQVAHSLVDAIGLAEQDAAAEICIIGGGQIFAEALPMADRLHLTEVDVVTDGDTRFPQLDMAQWREVQRQHFAAGPEDSAAFTYRLLERVAR